MAKLLDTETFRKRYFERSASAPTDEELKAGIQSGKIRGAIVCGKPYVSDDALFNSSPWEPQKRSRNPILEAV